MRWLSANLLQGFNSFFDYSKEDLRKFHGILGMWSPLKTPCLTPLSFGIPTKLPFNSSLWWNHSSILMWNQHSLISLSHILVVFFQWLILVPYWPCLMLRRGWKYPRLMQLYENKNIIQTLNAKKWQDM